MSDQVELSNSSADSHEHGSRESVFRLLIVLAAVAAAALVTGTTNTVLVVLSVVAMVMIHELGHFATAKWSGMKVTEYFLGFGPRIWSIRRGETEYGIKAIPAGGYVKIVGMSNLEEVDEKDEARTYRQQPFWQRIMVASAGSFMHFVMALLLLFSLYGLLGLPGATTTVEATTTLHSGPGPAQIAGLQAGDQVVAVNGQSITEWKQLQDYVKPRAGETVLVTIDRNGQSLTRDVKLVDRSSASLPSGEPLGGSGGFLGAAPAIANVKLGPLEAFTTSVKQMGDNSVLVFETLIDRFSPAGIASLVQQVSDARENGEQRAAAKAANQPAPITATDEDSARMVSPLGLVNYSDQAADAGIRAVLAFLFSINLFVGIFNLIPLLPFDGGHIAVAIYEKLRSLRGKRHMVDFTKLVPVSYVVLLALVFLGLSSFWIDLWYPDEDVFS